MSGRLLNNFREGNRSELLADYLLSAIGISTPVRRQDDYGFDFYCQLSDQESGYLTFGNPFIIQIKSNLSDNILYGNTNPDKWKFENISWLFRNKLPFFVGVIDKKTIELKIYDTTGLWQVYNQESRMWSQIELTTSARAIDEWRENCQIVKIENWRDDCGDGYKYIIDMGNPIINITYNDLNDEQILRDKKALLRVIIYFEQINIMHRDLGIRGFTEIKSNAINKHHFGTGMALGANQPSNVNEIYSSLKIGLIAMSISLFNQGRGEECKAIKNVLRFTPKSNIDEQLYNKNHELFDWVFQRPV